MAGIDRDNRELSRSPSRAQQEKLVMSKSSFSSVIPIRRLRTAGWKLNHSASIAKRRFLRFESLEERALLSVTIRHEEFKTVDFTFQGTFSGEGEQWNLVHASVVPGSGIATGSG